MSLTNAEALPTTSADSGEGRFDFQPPFADAVDGPDYANSLDIIEVSSSQRIRGKLLAFDVNAETVTVLEPRKAQPLTLDLRSIKYLRLEKPYQVAIPDNPRDAKMPGIEMEHDARTFTVSFKDRSELSGKTCGYRVNKNGVHFYE